MQPSKNYTLLKRLIREWADRNGLPDPEAYANEMIKFAEELTADYEEEETQ
jgi:hypothetical protein